LANADEFLLRVSQHSNADARVDIGSPCTKPPTLPQAWTIWGVMEKYWGTYCGFGAMASACNGGMGALPKLLGPCPLDPPLSPPMALCGFKVFSHDLDNLDLAYFSVFQQT